MRSYLVLAVVFCAGAGYGAPGRIVGGQDTSIEEYPGLVQVESMNVWTQVWGQSCAANILNSRYVLSAAHCFEGILYDRLNRRIRAGSTYRALGGQVVPIDREYNHPTYGLNGYDGDISVILLNGALAYNPVVAPVTIVAPNFNMPGAIPVIHAGWGAIRQGGPASHILQDVQIYTINHELCVERYANLVPRPAVVTENMICAGILDEGGKDACQGDSGGPLYYRSEGTNDIVVGVVSWGHGCANETYPGVSTAVSPYTEWIVQTAS